MTYRAIISVTVAIEIEDGQDHPDDWDYLTVLNATSEGSEVLSVQVSEGGTFYLHDCPNCGGHEEDEEAS